MSLSVIESCSVTLSVVTQRCTQKNFEDTSVYLRCGTNLKVRRMETYFQYGCECEHLYW